MSKSFSSAVRSNLLQLRRLRTISSTRQTPPLARQLGLNNPNNFFTAQGLDNRANDLNNLLDGMSTGINTVRPPTGITAITSWCSPPSLSSARRMDFGHHRARHLAAQFSAIRTDRSARRRRRLAAPTCSTPERRQVERRAFEHDHLSVTDTATGLTIRPQPAVTSRQLVTSAALGKLRSRRPSTEPVGRADSPEFTSGRRHPAEPVPPPHLIRTRRRQPLRCGPASSCPQRLCRSLRRPRERATVPLKPSRQLSWKRRPSPVFIYNYGYEL